MLKTKQRSAAPVSRKTRLFMLLLISLINFTTLHAQGLQEVTGTVTDSKGQPAIGVTVAVKGTDARSLTDQNGAFAIKASPSATLVFSSVNFQTAEMKIVAGEVMSVVLNEKLSQLNEN